MAGIGTIINSAAVVLGCLIGLFFKRLISEKMNTALMQALALCTMSVGIVGVIQGGMEIAESGLSSRYTLIMILSMVIGTIIGEAVDIDRRLDSLGNFLQNKFSSGESGDFSRGFVTATLTVCVGAMAIVGSLNDGLNHDPSVLIAKSILDFVICIIFASTLGIGAMFSTVPLFLYQGGITLFASFLKPLLTDAVIAQMTFIGSVLIMGIGFNFVYKPRLRLANMLPAVFVPLVWYGITRLF
ncbi:MAG: DUF554 domain-containing protein [Clostridia bacterium]